MGSVALCLLLVAVALTEAFDSDSCCGFDFSNSPVYGDCSQCCEFEGRGVWEKDIERTFSQGVCMCKRKTYETNRCCGTQDCAACCPKEPWNDLEYDFEMDQDLSYTEGRDCVCKIIWLDEVVPSSSETSTGSEAGSEAEVEVD